MKLEHYFRAMGSSKISFIMICALFLLALWFGFNEGFAAGQYFLNH